MSWPFHFQWGVRRLYFLLSSETMHSVQNCWNRAWAFDKHGTFHKHPQKFVIFQSWSFWPKLARSFRLPVLESLGLSLVPSWWCFDGEQCPSKWSLEIRKALAPWVCPCFRFEWRTLRTHSLAKDQGQNQPERAQRGNERTHERVGTTDFRGWDRTTSSYKKRIHFHSQTSSTRKNTHSLTRSKLLPKHELCQVESERHQNPYIEPSLLSLSLSFSLS